MNPFFRWLEDSGTQAVLVLSGTIASIIGAVAAVLAAKYGKAAPTREDLKRVEDNTSHLEGVFASIKRQEDADTLAKSAMFVSITATGTCDTGQPFSVYLTGTEPNPSLTRVEFRSESGNVFGTSECIPTGNLFQYTARLPSDKLIHWRNAGTGLSIYTTRHVLRVWMRFDEHTTEVYRDMAVTLNQGQRAIDGNVNNYISIYTITGAV